MFPEEDMLGVDLVFPDWSWLVERRETSSVSSSPTATRTTWGALAYFLRDINVPVYGTKLALELARGRIEEMGMSADLPSGGDKKWRKHGPFKFMLIPVSPLGSRCHRHRLRHPRGHRLHSGDFKLDPTPIDHEPDRPPRLRRARPRGVRLLLSDSTNAEKPGFVPSERSLGVPIARHHPGRPRAGDRRLLLVPHPPGAADRRRRVAAGRRSPSSVARCIATPTVASSWEDRRPQTRPGRHQGTGRLAGRATSC
jgi:mRNA degradation ribonuclease J1/J2